MGIVVEIDDPRRADIRAVLESHLAFSREVTPPEGVHALDVEGLLDPTVTFFSARVDGELLGVGALKELDEFHAELKSMHTVESARRQGVGRALVEHLLTVATDRNYQRVSLETGTMDAFAPARSLYAHLGFRPCPQFGQYVGSPTSACMSIAIGSDRTSSTGERSAEPSVGSDPVPGGSFVTSEDCGGCRRVPPHLAALQGGGLPRLCEAR